MGAFAATFWTGFKFLWRNPVTNVVLIAFPIVIILLLGNALSAYIAPDTSLDPTPVAVAAAPDGPFGSFIQSDEISRFFEIEFTDSARAKELAIDRSVYAAIIEENGDISVEFSPDGAMLTQLTLAIVDSYKQIGAAATIAAMGGRDVHSILNAEISVRDVPLGKRIPGAIDYYAVTMIVMILMYTGLNGMGLFQKGLLSDTGNRTRVAPISKPALIGGLLAASTLTSFLQGMVTFVFSGVVYGVYWGERIPLVLLTLFAVVLFSQSLCIFLVMALRHPGAIGGIVQALVWVMTFVSKGYAKISFGPMDEVFQYSPNALAHTVIFGSIFGGNETKMMFSLAVLFGIGAILFVLSFIFGRRRLA